LPDSVAERISIHGQSNYSYIGIPLSFTIKALEIGKISLGIGVNGGYLRQSGIKGKTIDKTELKEVDLNKSNSSQLIQIFTAGLDVDINYRIYKSIVINVKPDYRKQITKNKKTTNPKQMILSFGLQYYIF